LPAVAEEKASAGTSIDSFVREIARAPSVATHDPIGECFGRYRILALLGKGGMGRVYEAEDTELGRRVAVKFLPAAFADRAERVARFVRERVVTADLEHPAIIPVYDSGIWPSGEPFYAMRVVRGEPLDRRLATAPTLDERLRLLGHVIATADAVAFAHSRGVVHRDLKPANILVGSFGETFVADWGLAKRLREDDPEVAAVAGGAAPTESHETEVGRVLGTPAYMAPEQRAGDRVDARADVYALGAILHEMVAGRPPNPDAEAPGLSDRTLAAPLGDLTAIARKALSRDPAARYPNAAELALELHRFQTGQLVAARRYTRLELFARWLSRHRAVVVIVAAMTAVVLVVIGLSVARIVRERDVARTERAHADTANKQLGERNQALVLSQARAELTHDPTASLAWLKRYAPAASDWSEAERIASDAVARGVARQVWQVGAPFGSVAFSPDGATLAAGATDGTLVLLDVATGGARRLRAPDGVGARVVYSPDGKLFATSDGSEAVRLWDAASGVSRRLEGEHAGGNLVSFSHDGALLLVRHTAGADHLWRIPTGEPVLVPQDEFVIALGPPGTIYLARGKRLEQMDLASGRVIAHAAIDGPPYDLQSGGDGRWVAASRYESLVLWEPATGAVRRAPVGKVAVRVIAPSGDGRSFVTCGLAFEDWMFDAETATARLLSSDERCTRQAFSFSPDGAHFVSAGLGTELRIHDAGGRRLLLGHDVAATDAAFSPDGRWIASVSTDGSARLWSLDRGDVMSERGTVILERIARGARFLARRGDGSVAVVDLDHGASTTLVAPNSSSTSRGSLSADGLIAAFRDVDGTLVVWDGARGTRRRFGRYDNASAPVSAEVMSADGSLLAQADEKGGVRVIDTATGESRPVGRLADQGFGIALSGDARLVAASGRGGKVRVWDRMTGETRASMDIQAIALDTVFSRDGRRVAAASNDGLVYLLDVATGTVARLAGHLGAVGSLDFLPDGRLHSCGADGTVRLWWLDSGASVVVRRDTIGCFWLRSSVDGSLVHITTNVGCSIWKTSTLPPPSSDIAAFAAWAYAKTTADVDERAGRVRSPLLPVIAGAAESEMPSPAPPSAL
jgi:WD40 repeat protein